MTLRSTPRHLAVHRRTTAYNDSIKKPGDTAPGFQT